MVRLFGRINDLAGGRLSPLPDRGSLEWLLGNAEVVDTTRAMRDLGLSFRPLRETVSDAIRWWAEHGSIDRRLAGKLAPKAGLTMARAFPDRVEIVVEIPRGSRNKYEFDEDAGVFRLDRVLSSAVFYNFDYGFIEGTRADDGDHTDALLMIDEPTFTGCHVWARPVGVLEMRDEKGPTTRSCAWRRAIRTRPTSSGSSRCGRTASSRSSTSSRRTSCSRTRPST